ncbi:MAG: APC family permease [Bryobacteraceae bacterium]
MLINQSHDLKKEALSPLETLAQSISSIAPTAAPTVLIPLAFALSGNGTWFAYLLATVALSLVAMNISVFARYSASPGSLYTYAASVLPGSVGRLSAWALLIAYVGTASAVTGGFTNYTNLLLQALFGIHASHVLLTAIISVLATWIAYRDVKISARLMLAFEAISVGLITLVIAATLWKHGPHLDTDQFTLRGVSPGPIRLGLVIAIFSFVGFESATTLGVEAKDPLRTVPRAVILSAIFAGLFFMVCAYAEVLAFRTAHQDLSTSSTPLRLLAERTGLGVVDPLIDLGAVLSFFACALSCITAAARVLLIMSRDGLAHRALADVHHRNATPGKAAILCGIFSFLPAAVLAGRGASGFDINGWLGSLATYGFITSYVLVCVAMPLHLLKRHQLSGRAILLSASATLFMLAALVSSIYPVPPAPYSWLVALFLLYMAAGFLWSMLTHRQRLQQ